MVLIQPLKTYKKSDIKFRFFCFYDLKFQRKEDTKEILSIIISVFIFKLKESETIGKLADRKYCISEVYI